MNIRGESSRGDEEGRGSGGQEENAMRSLPVQRAARLNVIFDNQKALRTQHGTDKSIPT